MLTFLLVIQAIVAVLLVGVILMQQSEGGGLGMGGSPSGLMSARGAADFLTRSTAILAGIFIALSIVHAVLASQYNRGGNIDTSLARRPAPTAPPAAAPAVPIGTAPTAGPPLTGAPATTQAQAPATVPIATARPKVEPRAERTRTAPAPAATTAAPPPVAATVPASSAPAGNSN
ncbi:MAG: preprotein translocase subunit SecG [Pseudomonadota bacterium]